MEWIYLLWDYLDDEKEIEHYRYFSSDTISSDEEMDTEENKIT